MEYTDSRRYWPVRLFGMRPVQIPDRVYDVADAIGIGTSLDGQFANGRSGANALACKRVCERGIVRNNNILLQGGNHKPGGVTEAEGMRKLLESLPSQSPLTLHLEMTSKSTAENAERALEYMRQQNWWSMLVFAEALHAPRVRRTFRRVWKNAPQTFIVVPTYGLYDDAANWTETPEGFLLFNTGVTISEPIRKVCPPLDHYLLKKFDRTSK